MNQLLFEGQTLADVVGSIIRQDALHIPYNRLDWERMFRIADYHKVANIVYLGLLGSPEPLPERWRERFFERYQESLMYGANYKESVKDVLTWLDTRNISCTLLNSEIVREYYTIPEMADLIPLQIFLTEENYMLVRGYLIDLGYETDQVYEGGGERLRRAFDVPIILYHKLPFKTEGYVRDMRRILETAILRESYKHIRTLPIEGEMLYRMLAAAYRYVTDELTMREVLDLQLCHRTWREHIREDAVHRRLKDLKVDELAEKLLRLSYMWFGERKDTYYEHLPENMSEYELLEERLLTRGIINREADEQALGLQKLIQKEIEREKKEEERRQFRERMRQRREALQRWFRWAFPDYHYMASIYPLLEKIPVLLPFYWMGRGVRLLLRTMRG